MHSPACGLRIGQLGCDKVSPMTGGPPWTDTGSSGKTGREEKQGVYLLYEGATQMYGNRRQIGWELVDQDQTTSQEG